MKSLLLLLLLLQYICIFFKFISVINPLVKQKWAMYKLLYVFSKTSAQVYYTDYPMENADFLSDLATGRERQVTKGERME